MVFNMREEYDIKALNPRPNPYAKRLKQQAKHQITINISDTNVDYFKKMSANLGIPYQTLIDLYLSDCVANNRQLNLSWK